MACSGRRGLLVTTHPVEASGRCGTTAPVARPAGPRRACRSPAPDAATSPRAASSPAPVHRRRHAPRSSRHCPSSRPPSRAVAAAAPAPTTSRPAVAGAGPEGHPSESVSTTAPPSSRSSSPSTPPRRPGPATEPPPLVPISRRCAPRAARPAAAHRPPGPPRGGGAGHDVERAPAAGSTSPPRRPAAGPHPTASPRPRPLGGGPATAAPRTPRRAGVGSIPPVHLPPPWRQRTGRRSRGAEDPAAFRRDDTGTSRRGRGGFEPVGPDTGADRQRSGPEARRGTCHGFRLRLGSRCGLRSWTCHRLWFRAWSRHGRRGGFYTGAPDDTAGLRRDDTTGLRRDETRRAAAGRRGPWAARAGRLDFDEVPARRDDTGTARRRRQDGLRRTGAGYEPAERRVRGERHRHPAAPRADEAPHQRRPLDDGLPFDEPSGTGRRGRGRGTGRVHRRPAPNGRCESHRASPARRPPPRRSPAPPSPNPLRSRAPAAPLDRRAQRHRRHRPARRVRPGLLVHLQGREERPRLGPLQRHRRPEEARHQQPPGRPRPAHRGRGLPAEQHRRGGGRAAVPDPQDAGLAPTARPPPPTSSPPCSPAPAAPRSSGRR